MSLWCASPEETEAFLARRRAPPSQNGIEIFCEELAKVNDLITCLKGDSSDQLKHLERSLSASTSAMEKVESLKKRRTELDSRKAVVDALMRAVRCPDFPRGRVVDDAFVDDLDVLFRSREAMSILEREHWIYAKTDDQSLARHVLSSNFLTYESAVDSILSWMRDLCLTNPSTLSEAVLPSASSESARRLRRVASIMSRSPHAPELLREAIKARGVSLRKELLDALTQSSPDSLELHAYDPKTVFGNYLAWAFQTMAKEELFIEAAEATFGAPLTPEIAEGVFSGVSTLLGSRFRHHEDRMASNARSEVAYLEVSQLLAVYSRKVRDAKFRFADKPLGALMEPLQSRMLNQFRRQWSRRLESLRNADLRLMASTDIPPVFRDIVTVVVEAAEAYAMDATDESSAAVEELVDLSLMPLINSLRQTGHGGSPEAIKREALRQTRTFSFVRDRVRHLPIVMRRLSFLDEVLDEGIDIMVNVEAERLLDVVGLKKPLEELERDPDGVTGADISAALRHFQIAVVSGVLESTFTSVSMLPTSNLRSQMRDRMMTALLDAYKKLAAAGAARGVPTEETDVISSHLATHSFL